MSFGLSTKSVSVTVGWCIFIAVLAPPTSRAEQPPKRPGARQGANSAPSPAREAAPAANGHSEHDDSEPGSTASSEKTEHPSSASPTLAAGAQDDSEYRRLLEDAIREFNAGLFMEARSLFMQAHKARPTGQTWRALGLTDYELRRYDASVYALEKAVTETDQPLGPQERTQTAALLERAGRYVGRYYTESEKTAYVDGREAIRGNQGALLISIGQHEVKVGAQTWQLEVWGGERKRLSSLPSEAPPSPPQQEAAKVVATPPTQAPASALSAGGEWAHEKQATAAPFPWAPTLTLSGGAALILAGGGVGWMALGAEEDYNNLCADGQLRCSERAREQRDRANDLALYSDILWGAGAAVSAVGVIWLWFELSDESPDEATGLHLSPSRRADLGLDITGTF